MKLFLSSIGLSDPNKLSELLGKPLGEVNCGLITNAMDLKTPERREQLSEMIRGGFKEAGLKYCEIDLRNYFGKTNDLKKVFDKLDLIWSAGGNVFYLRYAMRESGFDQIVRGCLARGLVYGGDSAGALVVSPTLKTLDLVDDISQVPEVIYEGIGLVDFVPLPHWGNEKFQIKLEENKASLEKLGYKLIIISDGQAVMVDNGKSEIVGKKV